LSSTVLLTINRPLPPPLPPAAAPGSGAPSGSRPIDSASMAASSTFFPQGNSDLMSGALAFRVVMRRGVPRESLLRPLPGRFDPVRHADSGCGTHLSWGGQQASPCQVQVGQRKQHVQAGGVLGQTLVPHPGEAELALEDPKRVLHFRPQGSQLPVAVRFVRGQGATRAAPKRGDDARPLRGGGASSVRSVRW